MGRTSDRRWLAQLSGWLLVVGQVLYVGVTLLHTGGPANDHPVIFADYAASGIWTAVHLAQFACTAVMLAGLLGLSIILEPQTEQAQWTGRLAAACTITAFALYGVVLAVDGVALKQAADAWVNAPEAEKATRFAVAELARWLEWGARSYENFALGFALFLLAATGLRAAWLPRSILCLMGLSAVAYWVQGWTAGSEGFSSTHVIGIEAAEAINVIWAIWLLVAAARMNGPPAGSSNPDRA
jgi:hypothetical protein